MAGLRNLISSLSLLLACSTASSYQIPYMPGHFLLEAGGFYSSQGQNQTININTLIGDRYNVTKHHDESWLIGAGFLFDGCRCNRFGIDYGINAFYLAKAHVHGTITQELLFTNLAYRYYVTNLPVYLFAKAFVNTGYDYDLAVTLDAGVGPNFIRTTMQGDTSLDGITQPDNAFKGASDTVLSAMAGIGLKFCFMHQIPMEIGYRFFYLGEGHFTPRTPEILNKLKTGNNTAQALMLTFYI